MPGPEASNGDILEKLGELKGQVATLIMLVGQKREDINAMFARLGAIEKTSSTREDLARAETRISIVEKELAKWAGICLAASLALPLAIPYLRQGVERLEQKVERTR